MRYENFRTGDVFLFNSSKGIFHAVNVNIETTKTENNHPYVVRTSQNNGIRGYISEKASALNPANTISFAQDTAEMFYQSEPYFTGNKIKILSVKEQDLTEEKAMFLITCLKKAFCNFAWGSSYDTKILVEIPIGLPIQTDNNGNPFIDDTHFYHDEGFVPDFDYMQEHIAELKQERIAELEQERIAELEQYLVATGLNDFELNKEDIAILSVCKETRSFKVNDLFVVEGTKSLDAGKLTFKSTGVNFVGRTDDNNGIQGKIKKQTFEPNAGNTFTASVIGNYKYVKFQEEPYYCSQNINKLTPKFKITEKLGLWFRSEIQKFVSLYDGQQSGYKLNELKDFEFPVPIQTDLNQNPLIDTDCKYHPDGYIPDWEFMEKYIKAIEKIVIADVVKYKDDVIDKTRMVV